VHPLKVAVAVVKSSRADVSPLMGIEFLDLAKRRNLAKQVR